MVKRIFIQFVGTIHVYNSVGAGIGEKIEL